MAAPRSAGALSNAEALGNASDPALMAAHIDGHPEAFGELVRRHRDRLWSVALRTTRDPEDAADALQDAFISAFRNAASFRGQSAVTTWLHRIVVNACLDLARRRTARPSVPLREEESFQPVDPRDRIAERDLGMAVEHALGELPADQRAAIVLVDVQGFPVADAAEVLGVPVGTIKSRCARGRARMAVSLGHLRDPDGKGNQDQSRRV